MTDLRTYDTKPRMAKPKLYPVRLTLPLTLEMAAGVDAARDSGEDRVDFIRKAIDRELRHRGRQKPKG